MAEQVIHLDSKHKTSGDRISRDSQVLGIARA